MSLFNSFINIVHEVPNGLFVFFKEHYFSIIVFGFIIIISIVINIIINIIIVIIIIILLAIYKYCKHWLHENLQNYHIKDIILVLIILCDTKFISYVYEMPFNKFSYSELMPFIVFIFFRFVLHNITNCKLVLDLCFIPLALLVYKCSNSEFQGNVNNIITACVGWVTFWAFWAQLKANEIASDDAKRTGIQDTFNSMMETYNRNLLNLKYDNKSGLDAIDEYILIINNLIEDNKIPKEKFYLAYSYFYFIRSRNEIKTTMSGFFVDNDIQEMLNYKYQKTLIERSNHSALSTYYYQLYRIVKYIVVDNKDFLDGVEKKKYIGILRSQMSPNEQLLLFYNWLAGTQMNNKDKVPKDQFGYSWEDKDNAFFSEHKIIDHLNTFALVEEVKNEYKAAFKPKNKD